MNTSVRIARKKPIDIRFMVWPGGAANATPVIDWILAEGGTARYHEETVRPYNGAAPMGPVTTPEHIAIDTLEGVMQATPGDVIIRGIEGEFYPCKPGIFKNSYDILSTEHHIEEPS
jgi:hypothetical protein